MSIGAVLVGIALLLVVVAYLARPFRAALVADDGSLDRSIEAWVAQARTGEGAPASAEARAGTETGTINFCPQCGRRVAPDDRFCAGCGKQLRG
jgi:hypothetical protein